MSDYLRGVFEPNVKSYLTFFLILFVLTGGIVLLTANTAGADDCNGVWYICLLEFIYRM